MEAEIKNEHESVIVSKPREQKPEAEIEEVRKSVWGMPRLSEAKKDVISCEKLWGSANRN
jgi:hypothetical protein